MFLTRPLLPLIQTSLKHPAAPISRLLKTPNFTALEVPNNNFCQMGLLLLQCGEGTVVSKKHHQCGLNPSAVAQCDESIITSSHARSIVAADYVSTSS